MTKGQSSAVNQVTAAKMLGVSRATVRRMIVDGRLPATRLGVRVWTILRSDLDKLVRKGTASQ